MNGKMGELCHRLPNSNQLHQQIFKQLQFKHICSIAFSAGRIGMCFNKETISTYANGCTCNGSDHQWISTCNTTALIWLLQAVCAIHYNRNITLLHDGYVPVVDNQVVVTKGGTTFCKHHIFVSGIPDFFNSELHGISTYKLSLFYVNDFSCFSCCNQQFSLPA